jgi:glycosyltransferase involved in cell wall biosynthesis
MELQRNRIAMVSPSKDAYSETFIQAQKNGLKGNVFFYHGGALPSYLDGKTLLFSKGQRLLFKVKQKMKLNVFNLSEQVFINSLKENKIQVVLAQYGPTAHRILKICKHLNIPLITHFHGYDASVKSVIHNCNQYKEVFEYSSYIVAVSKEMEKDLRSLGCPSEKIVYNPCAPDNSFLNLEPQFLKQNFIGIGRFVNKKAPYYTILAFEKVVKKFPDSNLIIGGNGELYETCVNLVKYLKIEDNVSFPGVLSPEEFKENLQNSLAFVQHSITAQSGDKEGTPVAILEACSAGIPVVSTLHAGIPDVIIEGETGFLVEEHDVEMMAEKMITLIENKELAKSMGAKSKERIVSKFSMKKHLNTLDELIDKCCKINA